MKNRTSFTPFIICFLFTLVFSSCNNQPKSTPGAATTTQTTEENPMTEGGHGYTDPADEKGEGTTIENNGFVFIESTGGGLDNASYTVTSDGSTVSEGATKDGGYFAADMKDGKTYDISVSAEGYQTSKTTTTFKTGDMVKIGMKK